MKAPTKNGNRESAKRTKVLLAIAAKYFSDEEGAMLQTLEARGRDALDFCHTGVLCLRDALEEAYEAGRAAR